MTIFTGTFIPYEYEDRWMVYKYVVSRAQGIKKSLKLIEKDNEHLTVRCPLSGDYLDIVGTKSDVEWLNEMLLRNKWYKP